MADTIGTFNPLRYRGYVYDTETGLYYLQSRYYNPELGRFINADVFTSTDQGFIGNNMFAYCLNNPVNMADYNGNIAANVVGAIIGGIIGAVGGAFLGKWLADKLGMKKGWGRNLFIAGITGLVGASVSAIGYFLGPYVRNAWYAVKNGLKNLLQKSYKSIKQIESFKMKNKINVPKHAWNKVLKNPTDDAITKIIHKAIKYGQWELGNDGAVYIEYYIGKEVVRMSGKIINGIFHISDAWVKTQ